MSVGLARISGEHEPFFSERDDMILMMSCDSL